jgi:diguanylate cyclase (GGDEF)-like protein
MIVSGRVVGVISMQSYEPNAYTEEHIRLLETIANVAGVALENSRLFENAQAEIEQRRDAQESLLQANQDLQIQLNKVKALQHELREQATRDPLTGLHNRRFLNDVLRQRIQQAEQRSTQLSILMIDIDLFKKFNDSYGHQAGDALLQSLAGLLRRHTRSMDIACRYGGEEFLLVLSNTSLEIAARRAEQLRLSFYESENKFDQQYLKATISIGVAAFPTHGTGAEELIMQADQALYAAKAAGRNKVIVWAK